MALLLIYRLFLVSFLDFKVLIEIDIILQSEIDPHPPWAPLLLLREILLLRTVMDGGIDEQGRSTYPQTLFAKISSKG